MNKQQGSSAIYMLVVLILAFSGLMTFLKLLPLYTDDMAAETVFENVYKEGAGEVMSRARIYDMIAKRFDINEITHLMEFVEVTGQGSTIIIEMEYERRVPFMSNIELVATFTHNIDLSE